MFHDFHVGTWQHGYLVVYSVLKNYHEREVLSYL